MFDIRLRPGFSLLEALIATVIAAGVVLVLEGTLAITTRDIADSDRESIAARLAETQRERAFATGCAPSAGQDSVNAVTVEWTASREGGAVRVAQSSRYRTRWGIRSQAYDVLGVCR